MNQNEKPIRVVATPDKPYAFDCFHLYPYECQNPGYEIEYIYTIIHGLLDLKVELINVDSYSDVENALDTGAADIAGTSLMVDPGYFARWFYTPIYLWDGVGFISKESLENDMKTFCIFDAFDMDLWLSMLATTFIVVLISWASKRVTPKTHNNNSTCYYFLLRATHLFRSHLFHSTWFIVLSILLNFYSNLMVVQLVAPLRVTKPSFDSVPQLGKKLLRRECRLAIYEKYKDDLEFHKTFINPDDHNNNYWAKDYREAFKINPPIYTSSRDGIVKEVLNNVCVVGVDFATMKDYYNNRFCNIRFVSFPKELPLFGYVYYFTDGELARNVSAVMTSNAVVAYPDYLKEKYYFYNNPPSCESPQKNILTASLPLEKFQGVFILYFFAISCIGIFTFGRYAFMQIQKRKFLYCLCKKCKSCWANIQSRKQSEIAFFRQPTNSCSSTSNFV